MIRIRSIVASCAVSLAVAGCASQQREKEGTAATAADPVPVKPTGELIPERFAGGVVRPGSMEPTDERISQLLKVPQGFKIAKYAEGLGKPRMLAVGPDGTLYVTRRDKGDVLAIRPDGSGTKGLKPQTVASNLPGVHGIAISNSKLYLCTIDALYVCEMSADGDVGKPNKILEGLPKGGRHPNRTLAVDEKAGLVYITIGSTSNCSVEEDPETASIVTCNLDGSNRQIFARGLRNTLGFGWHPKTGELWGMDHGSDWLGDNEPPEELNRLEKGKFYGWPIVHGKNVPIPSQFFPEGLDAKQWTAKSTPMTLGYTAHAAPLQMVFYTADAFPAEFRGDAFVSNHGSWNAKPPVGYEVVRIDFDDAGQPKAFEPFVTGFLTTDKDGKPAHIGRPAGIAQGKNGDLFVGDDTLGVIYRVWYER